jgi:hypothetical protein
MYVLQAPRSGYGIEKTPEQNGRRDELEIQLRLTGALSNELLLLSRDFGRYGSSWFLIAGTYVFVTLLF